MLNSSLPEDLTLNTKMDHSTLKNKIVSSGDLLDENKNKTDFRSNSAPPRKRGWWFRKESFYTSHSSFLYDRMVSRRLVSAIATWHDIHSNLLQLTLSRRRQASRAQKKLTAENKLKEEAFLNNIKNHHCNNKNHNHNHHYHCKRHRHSQGSRRMFHSDPDSKSNTSLSPTTSFTSNLIPVNCKYCHYSFRKSSNSTKDNPKERCGSLCGLNSICCSSACSSLNYISGSDLTSMNSSISSAAADFLISSAKSTECIKSENTDLSVLDTHFSSSKRKFQRQQTHAIDIEEENKNENNALSVQSLKSNDRVLQINNSLQPPVIYQIRNNDNVKSVHSFNRSTPCTPTLQSTTHSPGRYSIAIISTSSVTSRRRFLSSIKTNSPSFLMERHFQNAQCNSIDKLGIDNDNDNRELESDSDFENDRKEEQSDEQSDQESELISDSTLDEIVELERKNFNRLSLSSPELTAFEIKEMFPDLSDHWRKALAKSPVVKRAAAMQEHERRRVSKHRTSRYWLDEQLKPAEHIWLPSSSGTSNSNSNDTECYIGENDCEKFGEKRQCAACHIVAHTACFPILSKMNLLCKTTFRDCVVPKRQSSTETNDALIRHHWVHRWKLEGRCQHCSKSFQQKIFREKEVIAITCSWCKKSYHNKRSCFSIERFDERCDRGQLSDLILPPEWLLRLSNRKRHTKTSGSNPGKKLRRKYRPFVVKPTDILRPLMPLLVFVNPKSGGNKGHKALNTLCWLLNPRQVFDITVLKGPKYGLEVFRNVANKLCILVAGGDGTVGWVLSTLDQLNWPVYPPMALVPLGTGNDLSRSMGWGGVFSDEPLSEILSAILHETTFTYLDRWQLDVQPNKLIPAPVNAENDEHSQSFNNALKLPLTVMNNYFSIGADAHVALQFHHSRSANPQMLNSRLKNRIAYGGLGTIDLFKRTWKDLTEYMTLECDDVDFTWKIREMKVHCVLFHNINYYAGGTIPWGEGADSGEYLRPSLCDGKIEVLGFTTATLAALQMGGKGQIIAQCSKIRIQTTKAIPMQVDGEPCLLGPSIIKLIFHSKVPMLRREKNSISTPILNMRRQSRVIMTNVKKTDSNDDLSFNNMIIQMHVPVIVVGRYDFDTYRDSIERLRDTGFELGVISVETEMELVIVRAKIQRLLSEHPMLPYEPKKDWRFIDYVSNAEEGTFRVSRHVERANIISDICNINECILIQDDAFPSITYRSAAITFAPTASGKMSLDSLSSVESHKHVSETLRIILSSNSQETHL